MAMIYPVGLPADDLEKISAFMRMEASDIPELTERGTIVFDRITRNSRSLWRVVVGRFEEHYTDQTDADTVIRPYTGGDFTTRHSDALYDSEGQRTGIWGAVIEDYISPTDAFEIGVPI